VTARTALPLTTLLAETIGDGTSDYNDGDHAGYYSYGYDPETGLLTVDYEPDRDAPSAKHASTIATFKLVSHGVSPDEDDDEDGDDE
jgi:hypothetical protein